jgi:phosphomannomutase
MVKAKLERSGSAPPGPALESLATALARSGARIDRTDGVRADFADGWVHVRPSNTEPIVRVIAEAATSARAEALAAEARSMMS